jgi:membrane-bound inhibitor of C-type lysozyme
MKPILILLFIIFPLKEDVVFSVKTNNSFNINTSSNEVLSLINGSLFISNQNSEFKKLIENDITLMDNICVLSGVNSNIFGILTYNYTDKFQIDTVNFYTINSKSLELKRRTLKVGLTQGLFMPNFDLFVRRNDSLIFHSHNFTYLFLNDTLINSIGKTVIDEFSCENYLLQVNRNNLGESWRNLVTKNVRIDSLKFSSASGIKVKSYDKRLVWKSKGDSGFYIKKIGSNKVKFINSEFFPISFNAKGYFFRDGLVLKQRFWLKKQYPE